MGILVLRHVACEGPGLLGDVLAEKGLSYQILDVNHQTQWPSVAGLEALIVMGGPQSVYEEDKFPYLAGENTFIQEVLKKGIPYLGICLGSQLLAKALGAKVYPNTKKEIGWAETDLSVGGKSDPLLSSLPARFMAFHWHGDTFDLPAGALHLASSSVTPNQAFRHGKSAWGLQFHLEVKPQDIRAWIQEYAQEARDFMPGDYEKDIERHYPAYREQGLRVFKKFLGVTGLA